MLRRLLILVFILANLTTQVSTAYACAMMGPKLVVSAHCCCKATDASHKSVESDAGKGCCQKIVKVSFGVSIVAAGPNAHVKAPSFDPAHVVIVAAAALPVVSLASQRKRDEWTDYDPAHPDGNSLYLRTQRLRL
jgi:hypothetical protein